MWELDCHPRSGVPCPPHAHTHTPAEAYNGYPPHPLLSTRSLGAERWDSLLLFILNPPNAPLPLAISAELPEGGSIPEGGAMLQDLLAAAGLIEPAEDTGGGGARADTGGGGARARWRTSQAGRRYLLEPPSAQVGSLVGVFC